MSDETQTGLDAARSAAFADVAEAEVVEHNGQKYEVRPLTLEDQRICRRRALGTELDAEGKKVQRVDETRRTALMVIRATYLPGTETRVFNDKDLDLLMSRRAGRNSLIAKVVKAFARVNAAEEQPTETLEEEAGN